jgi:hypothetical protein
MTVDERIDAWVVAEVITQAKADVAKAHLAQLYAAKGVDVLAMEYVSLSVAGSLYSLRFDMPAIQAIATLDVNDPDRGMRLQHDA